jgi:hypothetical protein
MSSGANETEEAQRAAYRRDCFVAPLLAMTMTKGVIASEAKQSRRGTKCRVRTTRSHSAYSVRTQASMLMWVIWKIGKDLCQRRSDEHSALRTCGGLNGIRGLISKKRQSDGCILVVDHAP